MSSNGHIAMQLLAFGLGLIVAFAAPSDVSLPPLTVFLGGMISGGALMQLAGEVMLKIRERAASTSG